MSNIELEFAKSNLIETVGAAISCGEISMEEAVSLFAERLSVFVRKSRGCTTKISEVDDDFLDFAAMEAAKPIHPLEDFPATPEDMMKLIRETNGVSGCDFMTEMEAREIL